MLLLPVALTTTGAAALVNFWLGYRIGRIRIAEKVLVGDGGNARLTARMRAQLNFAEYTPLVLILLALVELGGGTTLGLWAVGTIYIAGRIAHAIGMDGWMPGRRIGIAITMLTMIGLAAYALLLAFQYGNPMR